MLSPLCFCAHCHPISLLWLKLFFQIHKTEGEARILLQLLSNGKKSKFLIDDNRRMQMQHKNKQIAIWESNILICETRGKTLRQWGEFLWILSQFNDSKALFSNIWYKTAFYQKCVKIRKKSTFQQKLLRITLLLSYVTFDFCINKREWCVICLYFCTRIAFCVRRSL